MDPEQPLVKESRTRTQDALRPGSMGVSSGTQDLRETFKSLDANGDGFLTVSELRDGIEKA